MMKERMATATESATASDRKRGGGGENSRPIVSVVVEMDTRNVTGRIPLTESVSAQLNQVGFEKGEVEYIVVGADEVDTAEWGGDVSSVAVPDGGYYEYKNVGALHAGGKYVAFWDSDCRPSLDYLSRAVGFLESSPEVAAVTGVTSYDGTSWFTTMNTIFSFGSLHAYESRQPLAERGQMQSHNVLIRKDAFPEMPFGRYTARMAGDEFLESYAMRKGGIVIDPRLRIWHEPPTSLSALLERHLREVFYFALSQPELSKPRLIQQGFKSVLRQTKNRWLHLRRYGRHFRWGRGAVFAAAPVLLIYAAINACAVAAMAAKPSLLARWLDYQFGKDRAPVDADSRTPPSD